MKSKYVFILQALIILVVAASSFYAGFRVGRATSDEVLVHDTVTILDNIATDPVPTDTVYVKIPADVDTAAVLRQYYSKVRFADTVSFAYGTITIIDTIYQNAIDTRDVVYDLSFPTYAKRKNFKFSAGAFVSTAGGFGPIGSVVLDRMTISAGYDIHNRGALASLQYNF